MKFIWLILFVVALRLPVPAQAVPVENRYAHQLQLIDSLRDFIKNDLKINIPEHFYTDWNKSRDSMYTFLIVSKNDKIEGPIGMQHYWSFFKSEDSAIEMSKEMKQKGYQTMVYKTAGMANARLSPKLLSYPDEAIAFIVLHEATHDHVRSGSGDLHYPYEYEECLCDAVANKACLIFARKTKMLNEPAVLKQQHIFESLFRYLNKERIAVDSASGKEKLKIFNTCTSKVKKVAGRGNQFQKDRMIYEVNNAYFLRMGPYTTHYFEIKQMLDANFNIPEAVSQILKLHGAPVNDLYEFEFDPIAIPDEHGTPVKLHKEPGSGVWQNF